MLAFCSYAKLHWSKSALCVSMVCKCFHNSRSHFLAFLHELSKKVLTISKQGVWKVLKGLKKSRTLCICFCRLPVQCILSFSCQRFLCHWNLWDYVIKSSAIPNYDSFYCFQEVADKGSKITQLETEKSALIRDLFNNKAAGKNGFGPKKGNKIF